MASFEGKVVALTGGGSGIGLATAKILHARGASLALADISAKNLTVAAQEISQNHPTTTQKVTTTVLDVSKSSEVNDWIDSVVREHGKLDCGANIAGIADMPLCTLRDKTDEVWDRVMDVNARGVFNCMRAQLNRMEKGCSIVNVASVAGIQGTEFVGVYSASKHAVVGLTRTAAREEGPRGIRVNAVAPGVIDTPLTRANAGERSESDSAFLLQPILDRTPLKRSAGPEEVGEVIAHLLSPAASFQTGTVAQVDGGYWS